MLTSQRPRRPFQKQKKRNLLNAAEAFLHERKLEGTPCRFDVVAITGEWSSLDILHIESAFIG